MKTNLKIDGVYESLTTSGDVQAIASRIDGVSITTHMLDDGWSFEQFGKTELPDMLIYELSGSGEQELVELEALVKDNMGKTSVYVTTKQDNIDVVRRLMRVGVKDTFPQPIQNQELLQAITNEIALKRERVRNSQGGRGGVTAFIK